jgi:hypothetical protein
MQIASFTGFIKALLYDCFLLYFQIFSKTVSAIIGKKVVEKQVKICKSNNNRRKMLPGKDTNKDEVLYNTANAKILAKPKKG